MTRYVAATCTVLGHPRRAINDRLENEHWWCSDKTTDAAIARILHGLNAGTIRRNHLTWHDSRCDKELA